MPVLLIVVTAVSPFRCNVWQCLYLRLGSAVYQLWASCSHLHVTVIQQYNLVPVSKTGKVTLGGPTKSRPQPSGRRPDAVRVGWDSNPCKTVLIPVKQTEPPNRVLQQLADCKNGNKKNQIRLYGFFCCLLTLNMC